ncbi:hypothetical protein YPPY61_3407, partial [Yersinia pestis PY-61]
MICSLVFKL